MSDYLFMLESHLDGGQAKATAAMQRQATEAGMNVWITGGAMRDMLRGAPIRDLDFTVERDAIGAGRALAESVGGAVVSEDPWKRGVELMLPGGVAASVGNVRTEKYLKPGGKPHIGAAAPSQDLGALLAADIEIGKNFFELVVRGLRADLGRRIERIALLHRLDPENRPLHEAIVDFLLHQRAGGARANLALIQGEHRKAFERLVEEIIVLFRDIGKKDIGRLATKLQRHRDNVF